jgi:hypothetical protein
MMRFIMVALFLLGTMISTGHAFDTPPVYFAVETKARIVDEETGQSVEGAVVVAQWVLRGAWSSQHTLHIDEAITDHNGEFVIPGFRPKFRVPLMELRHSSPQLLIFKAGYQPLWLQNEKLEEVAKYVPNYKTLKTKDLVRSTRWWIYGGSRDLVQRSMWNGLSIEIEKFNGTSDRWLDLLEHFVIFIDDEDEKKLPRLFNALATERSYFKANPLSKYPPERLDYFFNDVDEALKGKEP